MSPFERDGPRWFSIPAHRPFVEDLASGLLSAIPDPEALADALVLTPTRRGARALAEAFVKANGGKAVLLPQIRALGDLDEGEPPFEPGDVALDLDPAISMSRRRFELARLVFDNQHQLGRDLDANAALEMADALGAFLDSCQIEEIDARVGLAKFAEGEMARHWAQSARVLRIAVEVWPARLQALGLVDVSQRRVQLLKRLAEQYQASPPPFPLIAAGSTGTAPATAELLKVIAGLPKGAVVLPGLDKELAETAWKDVGEQHPQGAMKRLLKRADVARTDVHDWLPDTDSRGRWRRRIINEALRPAEATADWRRVIADLRAQNPHAVEQGLEGMFVTTARTDEEAAAVCALLLRETLETPDRTAALVTPDRALARRVSARLARWGIVADSSAGAPLAGFPVGVLLTLIAGSAVDPLNPVALLAVLKHPMSRLGDERARGRLEEKGLRGARPVSWDALWNRLAGEPEALALAGELQAAVALASEPFAAGGAPAPEAAGALARALEALAGQEAWSGAGGEAAARLMAELIADSEGLPPMSARAFHELVQGLLASETVRTGGASHSRLRILGAIEARLVRADRLILAGLEDGVWPQAAPIDPFLSRPMREALGLPPPERRVGLTAHDFAQAACAPEVVLVHAERREGAPAVESRWLWRLKTLADGAGVELPSRPELLEWARALDEPGAYTPARRPAPAPPLADRPTKLSVTRVEALTRDPYAVWARDILKLRRLDRPDEPVEARARGSAIHKAFERFADAWADGEPDDAAETFQRLYLEALAESGMPRAALARETALAHEAAAWVADLECRRRADGREVLVEKEGVYPFRVGKRDFQVTARADRIELTPEGTGHILDYKTGSAPTKKQVETGFSPQLTLTAAILMMGGFAEAGAREPGDLTYLRVTGRRPAGEEIVRASGGESRDMAGRALEGLKALLEAYEDETFPYRSRVAPQFVRDHAGDYGHLARVFEWSTSGEDEGGEG
ncbi:MAG TPA: double-strand break repair protein AddB [Caulobacteraceae bacterium]